ncbi:vesicular amine transporter, partial [Penicillium maclennaniae]|uniref:vesicular amine transporter n=1 Tax=Penicillium maclennaniae TaxID=1343394 RepID=UPI00254109D7
MTTSWSLYSLTYSRSGLLLDPKRTQALISILLAESALVSAFSSPVIASLIDSSNSKQSFMLASLCLAGLSTAVMAAAKGLPWISIARLIQAIADNAMWIAGFATITDTIPSDRFGQTMGFLSMGVAVGTSAGTIVAGLLFEKGGYWTAWSSAFTLLFIDLSLRILMTESPTMDNSESLDQAIDQEDDPLLPHSHHRNTKGLSHLESQPTSESKLSGIWFYVHFFRQRRFVTATTSYAFYAMLVTSFDTTLPMQIRVTFNWGTLPAGLLFIGLQVPGILLTPLCGALKDRVGTRYPTGIGFLLFAPFFGLLGIPGSREVSWASGDSTAGKVVYVVSVIMVGCFFSVFNGLAFLEATCKCKKPHFCLLLQQETFFSNSCQNLDTVTVDGIKSTHHGIFGTNSGYARANSIARISWTMGMFLGPATSRSQSGHSKKRLSHLGL